MLSRILQFHFAVLLVLSFSSNSSFAQNAYDKAALDAAIANLKKTDGVPLCNPMIDPGCHIPVPGSEGPDGCSDCVPMALGDVMQKDQKLLMPDELTINGSKLKLLEKNKGSGTLFAVPGQ